MSITSINNGLEGLREECELRMLRYFDVYQSFLSDTLHTLYEGAMVEKTNGCSINNGHCLCYTRKILIKIYFYL